MKYQIYAEFLTELIAKPIKRSIWAENLSLGILYTAGKG